MTMPGRKYSNGGSYRYGFNGQEKSTELNDNLTTAEFWEYDSRIGRRWNVDPITKVGESPYLCFSGNPIYNSDPVGNVSSGLNDWVKKKNSNGTTSYKWDGKAKNQSTTPAGYTYVGATHKYAAGNNVDVNLFSKGDWFASSGVTASSGFKGDAPPTQAAPSATSSAPLNIKPGPQVTVGPVGFAFNNDFERGMIQDNIATNASVMLVAPQTIVGKLVVNTGVQLAVNGKNADFADIGINSFSPYSYGNQWATALVDWKPLSGDMTPKVFPFNKDPANFALDVGINHVFYGYGEFQKKVVSGQISEKTKLIMGAINTANKAVIKKTFNEGFFPAKNVSESTQAPPLFNPLR